MKVLNIISSAYRAASEEQDDTIVWLSHALANAGADLSVLLTGAAVNYVVEPQPVPPITIGMRSQLNAPDVHGQVRALAARLPVHVVEDDLEERGIANPAPDIFRPVPRAGLASLLSAHDQVWHW